jgi:hypothetical protein
MSNLTAEQTAAIKLDIIHSQDAARSAKYYLKKKDIILQRRKDKRAALKETKKTKEQPNIVFDFSAHIPNEEEELKMFNREMGIILDDKPVFTLEKSITKLEELDIKQNKLKTYVNNLKQFMRISGCNDLEKCLKEHNKIIDFIENGQKKNGSGLYSNNTKAGLYQTILYLIDTFGLKIDKTPYKDKWLLSKAINNEKVKTDNETLEVPTWSEYLERVKDSYGDNSMEYLLINIYKEVPMRDDMQLLLTDGKIEFSDNINYLVMPEKKTKKIKLLINKYKTGETYGKYEQELRLPLTRMINKYIKENNILIGGYLFGNKKLTGIVSNINKTIGYDSEKYKATGINFIRKIAIANANTTSPENQLNLAKSMGHSTETQQRIYKRKLDK